MLLKALVLAIILYFAFRAARGLLRAALNDPKADARSRPLDRDRSQRGESGRRRPPSPWGDEEIEDAQWKDL